MTFSPQDVVLQSADLRKKCGKFQHILPSHQGWCSKWKLSRNMYSLHTRFLHVRHRLANAHLALINKISASELSRKFIKGPLLVGRAHFFAALSATQATLHFFMCNVMCNQLRGRKSATLFLRHFVAPAPTTMLLQCQTSCSGQRIVYQCDSETCSWPPPPPPHQISSRVSSSSSFFISICGYFSFSLPPMGGTFLVVFRKSRPRIGKRERKRGERPFSSIKRRRLSLSLSRSRGRKRDSGGRRGQGRLDLDSPEGQIWPPSPEKKKQKVVA